MFYYLFLGNVCTFDQLKKDALKFLNDREDFLCKYYENESTISCKGFTISFHEDGRHVCFKSEDYKMDLKYWLNFEILNAYTDWAEELMVLIGNFLKLYNSDCILESNGDTPIVIRKNTIVTVDDSKLRGTERFPFHYLGVDYQEGDLKTV
jgi:hypothetical protein